MSVHDQIVLLDRATQALRGHGLMVTVQEERRPLAHRRSGTWLRVSKDAFRVDYAAEVKRKLKRNSVGTVVKQMRYPGDAGDPLPLLITDHVTTSLAQELRDQHQQFADAVGNVYLEGQGLLVYVTGRKPRQKQLALLASKSYPTTRLKVLFALICDPELIAEPLRAIAAAADVAAGAMATVIADLKQQGHVLIRDRRRYLNGSKHLLDDWAHAYASGLRVKTLSARYLAADFDSWAEWLPNPARLRWGGEPAAKRLGCDLQPSLLTLYGDKLPVRLFRRQRLLPAGPVAYENLVELRRPFWGKSLRAAGPMDTVAPALIYADLLATGNPRCMDAARMLYHSRLERLFPSI